MTKTEFFKQFNRIVRQIKGIDTGTEEGMKKFQEIMEEANDFRRNFYDNQSKEIMSEKKSPDYYRGFHDGYQAARKDLYKINNPPDIGRMPVGPGLVEPQIKCTKCGMMWQGVMGYVCPRMDCLIQPKIIAASNQEKL